MDGVQEDRHPVFKLVLLGEVGVGKSSLFIRMKDDTFDEESPSTLVMDNCTRTVTVDGEKVSMCIWDTAGVEKFRTITRNYYRNTQAVLLVYDVNNPASLHYLSKWANDAIESAPHALRFLIGSKSDLEKTILTESVDNFEYTHTCCCTLYTSAKTGHEVDSTLQTIAEELMKTYKTPLFYESQYLDTVNLAPRRRTYRSTASTCC